MNFQKLAWLPIIIGAVGFLIAVITWREYKFFRWVKAHWFLNRSPFHTLGTLAWFAGIILLSVVLLDPREGEIKIKGKVRQDRTIILIDTSTSMLAEDVKPNRLERAVLLAKHFARRAVGHEIAVMVFADISKKLMPFTTDRDLLDARIDSVKQLRNLNAGSSIGLAIEEAVRHFDPSDDGVTGNILVITDGEDNEGTEEFKTPPGVSLVFIGVGTKGGAPIPMKDAYGFHHGNKKTAGVTVTTRLNEAFFARAVKENSRARYFLAQSYDLPTDEVLAFMNERKAAEKEGDNIIRPVAMETWAIPGLLLLAIGILLRGLKPFSMVILLLCMHPAWAQKEEPALPPELINRLEDLRQGKLDSEEAINLADQLVKAKALASAKMLYEENLPSRPITEHPESNFNWATLEMENGNIASGLSHYDRLERALQKSDPQSPLIPKIRENIRRAMLGQAPPQKQKQEKKDDKDNKGDEGDKQDQSKDSGQGDSKGEGKSDGKSDEKKNPFDPKNKEKSPPQSGEEKGEEKKPDAQPKPEEKPPEEAPAQPKQKLSPLLEQLKQDDRKLQLKLLDTSTQKRTQGRKKDW